MEGKTRREEKRWSGSKIGIKYMYLLLFKNIYYFSKYKYCMSI